MERENEFDFTERFINYLISIGYPKESIVNEYAINKRNHVDIAIIDPTTNIIVQIFELKGIFSEKVFKSAQEQLKFYLAEIKTSVPAYMVFKEDASQSFKIIDYNSLKDVDFIDYNLLLNKAITTKNGSIEEKKKEKINLFKQICWFEALILASIMFCKKTGILCFELSWIDLSMIGTAVVLSLLPFFGKIAFNGLEFVIRDENNTENARKSSKE
ncbi:MAG: type I restriction enzyme HsdR N-terminal domain-containing protein [Candidatus Symbiothrix sp.]|jgi:hypothetical protein|nr:type I restriction enzyme HsdR N-terminal domain-containing protein [Candidatus Symbiothrix sp.]